MAIVIPFVIAAIDFLGLLSQTMYMFAAGVTLREAIELAVWALRC